MRRIEPLAKFHDRDGFDCGSEPLNSFLKQTARQHANRGISRTFVFVDEAASEPKPILGFFALNLCQVKSESLSPDEAKAFPRNLSGVRLGRLAVSNDNHGHGLGKILLVAAMKRFIEIFNMAGGVAYSWMRKTRRRNLSMSILGLCPCRRRNWSYSCRLR